jgi:hypothetical protein
MSIETLVATANDSFREPLLRIPPMLTTRFSMRQLPSRCLHDGANHGPERMDRCGSFPTASHTAEHVG